MLNEMRKKNHLLVNRGSVNCVALKGVRSLCTLLILRAVFYVLLYFGFLLNKESFRLRGMYSVYMGGRGGDRGMLLLLLLELKGACPTSDAWAYTYLQRGYVQQLSKNMDIEASIFLLKALHLFIYSSRLSNSFKETCDVSDMLLKILSIKICFSVNCILKSAGKLACKPFSLCYCANF